MIHFCSGPFEVNEERSGVSWSVFLNLVVASPAPILCMSSVLSSVLTKSTMAGGQCVKGMIV